MEIWITLRADGKPGTGTQSDPYDGSTTARFDGVLASVGPSSVIHLERPKRGSGPPVTMRTASQGRNWQLRNGWRLLGEGMYDVVVQLAGPAPSQPYIESVIPSYEIADNVICRDFTCDSNWAELELTSPTGLGGEKNCKVGGFSLCGSNGLIENVRAIHGYGSSANGQENFDICVLAQYADAIGNVIRGCRAEQPAGNYGNPFALLGNNTHGWLVRKAEVIGCLASSGVNNGHGSPFSSGGVNVAGVQNCVVNGCIFIDCMGLCYTDTGDVDGLEIVNCVATRGWAGITFNGMNTPHLYRNLTFRHNHIDIQNRWPGGCSGITLTNAPFENVLIEDNEILKDGVPGLEYDHFRGIWLDGRMTKAQILRNTVNGSNENFSGGAQCLGNHDSKGKIVPGLEDTVSPTPTPTQPPTPASA